MDRRRVEIAVQLYIPRIGDGKSWKGMPVTDSDGKMQATAPYGYARDDGMIGLLLVARWMVNYDGGSRRRGAAAHRQGSEASLTWHTIHTPPSLLAGTLVYLSNTTCPVSINCLASASSAMCLYS